jgi:hypothetical protein
MCAEVFMTVSALSISLATTRIQKANLPYVFADVVYVFSITDTLQACSMSLFVHVIQLKGGV